MTATTLINPADKIYETLEEGRHYLLMDFGVRAAANFRLYHQYRDKAVLNALYNFRSQGAGERGGTPGDIAVMARYFRSRFERERTLPGEHIVQTDVWYGSAPVTIVRCCGAVIAAGIHRAAAIETYRTGDDQV